ncbi:L-cystine transporter [Sporolactobacillus terrae]|uniref:L-cystine uptake protein TcyP n=1 Tax=Sporolactobacillus terrae TaxID=269673 RepID=A0A5K7X709_9BACL|nr:L-cystine transporter [Sporolactobacillus terrae]BBN99606.1 L-cystine uptake protein TcyP [Sporolactobacillus terrae]
MDIFYIVTNLVVFALLIGFLIFLRRKHVSFSKRVFSALGLGILFGVALNLIYGSTSSVTAQSVDWFNIAGNGYVTLLQMVVMPLVFISIVAAFTKLKITKNIGKISALVIGTLLGTVSIAAFIGIVYALVFGLDGLRLTSGAAEAARNAALQSSVQSVQNLSFPQQIVSLLPANPFADLTGTRPTSTIAVVIFAAFIGIAYLGVKRKQPDKSVLFANLVDTLYAVIIRMVRLVLRLTPYGILALIARFTATSDYSAILKLGQFVVASYAALITMFVIHLIIISLLKLNPATYVRKALPTLTFAFTSRSSAGTLPLNVETQTRQFGISDGIANFAGSFGLTIGQNGCAGIYPAMLAIMAAPSAGVNPSSPSFILMLILVVAISSFGVAGVGGGATFASLIVLSILNFPVAIVGLLISVEPLIDMGRTALNVSDAMVAGLLTGRATGELNKDVYDQRNPEPQSAV